MFCLTGTRSFRRPTGIERDQTVEFCFRPALSDTDFFLNEEFVGLVTLDGLSFADITDIMRNINRLEIRWKFIQNQEFQEFNVSFIEQFEAWLEIKTLHQAS